MIYERSDSTLDDVSQFTPQSFLGAGRRGVATRYSANAPGWGWRSLRGNPHRMSLGQWDFLTDAPAPETGAVGSGGLDWNSLIGTAGQAYTTYTQAQLSRDLATMNMQRAAQGLAPIPASSVAPQMNVGLGADTQRMLLMLGLGMAVILGGAYAFGVIGKKGRRR